MNELPYILLDQLSMNQLGEFDTYEEAEEVFFRFVRAEPSAAEHLEIWHEGGTAPIPVDPEKLHRVTTG